MSRERVDLARALFVELPSEDLDRLSSGLAHVVGVLRHVIAEASENTREAQA